RAHVVSGRSDSTPPQPRFRAAPVPATARATGARARRRSETDISVQPSGCARFDNLRKIGVGIHFTRRYDAKPQLEPQNQPEPCVAVCCTFAMSPKFEQNAIRVDPAFSLCYA